MTCPICGQSLKRGAVNTHHKWFPRDKYRGTAKGRVTMEVHVICHNQFNWFFKYVCRSRLPCIGCNYQKVCCYYKGVK